MVKDFLCSILSSDIEFNENITYRRIILINAILILSTMVLLLFSLYNISVEEYTIATYDFFTAIFTLLIFFYLRATKNVSYTAKVSTSLLALFFILLIQALQGAHSSFIWTVLLPILAIMLNGKRVGLYFTIAFYTILFTMAFNGLGIWADGTWNEKDLIRIFSSALVLTYLIYFNEFALERSDAKLQEIRLREHNYMKKLKEYAITDELTMLYNRRHFNELAPKLLALAKRRELYFTFFIIDVDHFKGYNDNYGHQAGDEALIKVANILKQHIQRNDDFVFRLGGDEFAGIILTDEPDTVYKHIEEVCTIVEEESIIHDFSTICDHLTTTIGIVAMSPTQQLDIEDLYKAADKNLYKAKQNGKNQCVYTVLEDKNTA